MKGTSQPAWSQRHTLLSLSEDEKSIWISWFDSLPAIIETNHAIIVHARLDPDKQHFEQDSYFTAAVGGERVNIECNADGIPLWYSNSVLYPAFHKPICFGHIEYNNVELIENKLYALDTGASKGGRLTAVVFPGNKLFEVEIKTNYYEIAHKEWMEYQYRITPTKNKSLSELSKIEKNTVKSEIDNLRLQEFSNLLTEFQIYEKLMQVKFGLVNKFGPVPDENVEKGVFLNKLAH